MTWRKRTIMEMAQEAGMLQRHNSGYDIWIPEYLEAFAEQVREEAQAKEREACAKLFDGKVGQADLRDIAAAIRARGQA